MATNPGVNDLTILAQAGLKSVNFKQIPFKFVWRRRCDGRPATEQSAPHTQSRPLPNVTVVPLSFAG